MQSLTSSISHTNSSHGLAPSPPVSHPDALYPLDEQTCYIKTLPTEILLLVFKFLNPGDVFDPSAAQWVVSRVCQQWSHVAAACHDLWSCITVTVSSAVWCPNSIRRLREVVFRSGDRPLHVTFDMTSRDRNGTLILSFFEEKALQLLAVLTNLSDRWVSVDLRGLVTSCAKALDAVTGKLSQLEVLHIDCDANVEEDIHAFDDAPCLRAACIGNAPMHVMNTRSLVSLATPSDLTTDMLSECPKLEQLTAYLIAPSSSFDGSCKLSMESITHLSLTDDLSLMYLDLPNLVELELAEAGAHCALTVTDLFERSRCPLRKLSLPVYRGGIPPLVAILRRIPNVEEVVIEFDTLFRFDEAEAERRGVHIALQLLYDFICVTRTSLPYTSLRLTQFRLSFKFLNILQANLLHYTFCSRNRVQDFLLEGNTLSFKGGFRIM